MLTEAVPEDGVAAASWTDTVLIGTSAWLGLAQRKIQSLPPNPQLEESVAGTIPREGPELAGVSKLNMLAPLFTMQPGLRLVRVATRENATPIGGYPRRGPGCRLLGPNGTCRMFAYLLRPEVTGWRAERRL
jgi:hypothetical protein